MTMSRGWAATTLALSLGCGPTSGADGTGGGTAEGSGGSVETATSTAADDTMADGDSTTQGPAGACEPGNTRACYGGPPGTEGVGACAAGQETCQPDGLTWSACEGEVVPAAEQCTTPADESCDDSIVCTPAIAWVRPLGGAIEVITTDASDRVIVAGEGLLNEEIDGIEISDLFIASFEPDGELRWAANVEELNEQSFTQLRVGTDDSITAVGSYDGTPDFGLGPLPLAPFGDTMLVRWDVDGNVLWNRGLDISEPRMSVTSDGTTVLAGVSGPGTIDGQVLGGDFYVATMDVAGQLAWYLEGAGFVYGLMTVAGSDGAFMVLVQGGGTMVLDGNAVDLPALDGIAAWAVDASGSVLASAVFDDHARAGNLDGWVLLPRDGDLLELVGGVSIMPRPEVYESSLLRFRFDDTPQSFAPQLLGSEVGLRGAAALPELHTLAHSTLYGPNDFGGATVGPERDGDFPLALIDLDDAGTARWAMLYDVSSNGPSYAGPGPVTADSSGAVLVTGYAWEATEIAGRPLENGFLVKLVP